VGEEAKDKLMMRSQRYFFKEGTTMDKLKDAERLVDLAFDESFEIFGKVVKAEKKIDKILDTIVDECGGMMGGGSMNKGIADMEADAEEPYEDDYMSTPDEDEPNDISHVPNQDAQTLYKSVIAQLGEINSLSEDKKAEYRAFFQKMLKKFGVTSPAQLDDAKKKAFFDAVDKGWKGVKESAVLEVLDK
jgi:hypothetical protein